MQTLPTNNDSESEDDNPNIAVIDNGSSTIKAGGKYNQSPMDATYDELLYEMRYQPRGPKSGVGGYHKRIKLKRKYPIEKGIITSWDTMEIMWNNIFSDYLRINPKEYSVMLTEAPLTPMANREKTTQIMFETFNIPAMFIQNSAVCSIYTTSKTTGVVLESGHGVTNVVPIYEGYAIKNAIRRLDVAGNDITDYLYTLLNENGYTSEKENVRDIKETLSYIALTQNVNTSNIKQKQYELPDGQIINIGAEIFKCCEALFTPSLVGSKSDGIHKLLHKSVMTCDKDLRDDLCNNIVLSGGNTLFNGFDKRIRYELQQLLSGGQNEVLVDGYIRLNSSKTVYTDIIELMYQYLLPPCNVIADSDRKYASWTGAKIISSVMDIAHEWIIKDMYDEYGPGIVHRMCF